MSTRISGSIPGSVYIPGLRFLRPGFKHFRPGTEILVPGLITGFLENLGQVPGFDNSKPNYVFKQFYSIIDIIFKKNTFSLSNKIKTLDLAHHSSTNKTFNKKLSKSAHK